MTTDPADQTRTTWPAAQPLQEAADLHRAAGAPLLADWLDATANALAWLAPYRDNEPGYAMWEAALAVARQVLGTVTAPPEGEAAPVVDRAAILREVVDALDALEKEAWDGADTEEWIGRATGVGTAKDTIRRLADEAQQPAPATLDPTAAYRTALYDAIDTIEQLPQDHGAVIELLRRMADDETEQPTDTEQEPIPLRWGLDDVMWGDDDTTVVMLSGPDGEPYWLELDAERVAVLRDALAGPAAPPAPADQAAFEALAAEWEKRGECGDSSITDRARELRAVLADGASDEAQQPADEAHPAEHTWAAELYDPLADEWIPGTRYLVRDRAVNALNHARKIGPKWKDGTPTERRLVRATTTYTVEQPVPAVTEEPTP